MDSTFKDRLPRLEGLLALSQTRGLDVRPILLRVLTDMFVSAPHCTESDSARFTELAAHLIDQVDGETRHQIAEKLGPCPATPRVIVDKLITCEPRAADKIISLSPALTGEDLWTLATDGGPITTAAIAKRSDLDRDLMRYLLHKGYSLVAEMLAANLHAPLDRDAVASLAACADNPQDMGRVLSTRSDVDAAWLAPFFLDLDAATRVRIVEAVVAEIQTARISPREAHVVAATADLDALEQAALSRNTIEMADRLQALFGFDAPIAARMVADPGGDALALSLIASGMAADQAGRILMFVCPQAASVSQMRHLTLMLETVPRIAATRLVRAMSRTAAPHSMPRHEPIFVESSSPRLHGHYSLAQQPAALPTSRQKSQRV